MKHQIILFLGAILLLQLTGCSSITHQISDQPSIKNPTLAELENWKVTGKLAVRTPQQAQSISLIWHQQNTNYKISLNGPMGFGSAIINGNQLQTTIQNGSKTLIGTPDQLGAKLLGIPLSTDAMSWWIKGLASPNQPKASNIIYQQNGLISSLQQSGWQLQFSTYQTEGIYKVPKKITGRRGELSFKLVINQWNLFD